MVFGAGSHAGGKTDQSRNAQLVSRTLGGRLLSNKIVVKRGARNRPFEYTIRVVTMVDDKLQFRGTFDPTATSDISENVTATLAGTLSIDRSPSDHPGTFRPRLKTTTKPPDARGAESAGELDQLSQATPSLATEARMTNVSQEQELATDANTGCEIMYLTLRLPARFAPRANQRVQLGVVLDPIDNPIGVKINQYVCQIVRALQERATEGAVEASLTELNRLLSGER